MDKMFIPFLKGGSRIRQSRSAQPLQPFLPNSSIMEFDPKPGNSFTHVFRFSQADVEAFAQVTGDNNPLHLDAGYAETTPFKRPIIHGMLGASVFTKVLGTQFPGFGSVYLKQTLDFMRPMFVDTDYEGVFTILSVNADKHTAEISTEILDRQTRKVTTRGVATLMNKEKF
jgi:acyl dehydratase